MLGNPERAILKFIDPAIASALSLWKHDQAGSVVDGVFRQSPHALKIGRAAHVRHGHVAEALHQPAVHRNLEVRFEFPAADKLWNGAVEHEGSNRLTWLEMKKQVRLELKPGERTTLSFAPAKKMIRRQKARCSQSCFFGSRKTARPTRVGTAMPKCSRLTVQSSALRTPSQARLICTHPGQRAECPGCGIRE